MEMNALPTEINALVDELGPEYTAHQLGQVRAKEAIDPSTRQSLTRRRLIDRHGLTPLGHDVLVAARRRLRS